MSPELLAAGRRRYVSLTTFRRSGVPVATPVWIAPVGDVLVVMTDAGTGKVKRLRKDARVELRECTMTGRVREGARVVTGTARIVDDEQEQQAPVRALARKYGLQFWSVTLVERILAVGEHPDRVVLRIRDA